MAQQLREKHDTRADRVYVDEIREYLEIPVEDCFKYVTLLNLRTKMTEKASFFGTANNTKSYPNRISL